MKVRGFGKLSDGRSAGLYVLKNSCGMEVSVTDYGAAIASIIVPGKNDIGIDVVLGYGDAASYEAGGSQFGATVGRIANRVGDACFTLNGETYEMTANNGSNALHGGRDFYNKRLWETKIPFASMSSGDVAAKVIAKESMNDWHQAYIQDDIKGDTVTFCLDSPDGDQGMPGNLHIEVTYMLTNDNELHIDYAARCDRDTPVNLTNHSYFNLNGHGSETVLNHICRIDADRFTPCDEGLLPTGEVRSVSGTPMDFRIAKPLGADIRKDYEQLKLAGGYDHNYVLNGSGYREAATLYSESSGIHMSVLTDMPGMQLYTANGLGPEQGKGGALYSVNSAVCFETQFWPDSINKENFPDSVLKAGERFTSRTTYRFIW